MARTDIGRVVGQDSQRGCFCPAEFFRFFPEIAQGGCAVADDVPTVGCVHEIEFEDLVLAVAQLNGQGLKHLQQLVFHGSFLGTHEPCHLHGDCAGTADAVSMADVLVQGAHYGQRVHAPMSLEPLIFVSYYRCLEFWGDGPAIIRQDQLFLTVEKDAQNCTVFVEHHCAVVSGEQGIGEGAESREYGTSQHCQDKNQQGCG